MRKGHTSPDRLSLKRWFGDLEVVEAKQDIRIQPNDDDIKNAIKNDPSRCVFSQACKRMWSSTAVVFFGTIACATCGRQVPRRRRGHRYCTVSCRVTAWQRRRAAAGRKAAEEEKNRGIWRGVI